MTLLESDILVTFATVDIQISGGNGVRLLECDSEITGAALEQTSPRESSFQIAEIDPPISAASILFDCTVETDCEASLDIRAIECTATVNGAEVGCSNGELRVTNRCSGVQLVSVGRRAEAADAASGGISISRGGCVAAFFSNATDLIEGDHNETKDVFIRNLAEPESAAVRATSIDERPGAPSHSVGREPAVSADGTIIAFYTEKAVAAEDTNGLNDVYAFLSSSNDDPELISANTQGVAGNGSSVFPQMSADGSFIVFQSLASDLVDEPSVGVANVFVRDRRNPSAPKTERICERLQPGESCTNPAISGNGRIVAYVSKSASLDPRADTGRFQVFVSERAEGDGERLFASRTAPQLVSVNSAGAPGNGDSIFPALNYDGRFVAFKSTSSNLAANDVNRVDDVFVHDRLTGSTERISVNRSGGDADDSSFPPSISDNGRFVAFGSAATNLVFGDVNDVPSIFLRDRVAEVTILVDALGPQGAVVQANGGVPDARVTISRDGGCVAFASAASNLGPRDHNETLDVFVAENPLAEAYSQGPIGR